MLDLHETMRTLSRCHHFRHRNCRRQMQNTMGTPQNMVSLQHAGFARMIDCIDCLFFIYSSRWFPHHFQLQQPRPPWSIGTTAFGETLGGPSFLEATRSRRSNVIFRALRSLSGATKPRRLVPSDMLKYGGWLRNPNHQLKTLNGGKHPMIYRVSTIQGGSGFRNHPQYGRDLESRPC